MTDTSDPVLRKSRERLHGVLLGARSHMRMHQESAEAFEEYDKAVRAPLEARIEGAIGETLTHHWPTSTSGCQCGGVSLGHSYPAHIARITIAALRESVPSPMSDAK